MTNYCDTTKLSIRQIDKKSAKKMVVNHHYSKLWTKCSVALGLFHKTGNQHAFFDEDEEKMIGNETWIDFTNRIDEKGAQLVQASDEHDAGQQLNGLGGAIALLRWKID